MAAMAQQVAEGRVLWERIEKRRAKAGVTPYIR